MPRVRTHAFHRETAFNVTQLTSTRAQRRYKDSVRDRIQPGTSSDLASFLRRFVIIRHSSSCNIGIGVEANERLITRLRVAHLMGYVVTGRETSVSHDNRPAGKVARTGDRGCTGESAEISGDANI